MALDAGSKLGHYEVISSLGAGGMGEVYRARDTSLGREVAIKVLSEAFAHDPERMARFEREAKVLAGLNHSNIATLYSFEADGGTRFLVMEVVEGETLADRIERGAVPLDEALPLFLQIAEGLEAAHENGVVHRDLKPANVKVADDGHVKILDFGLAKAMALETPASEDPDLSRSPTLTLSATQRGEILGTAAYMSPEQARGRAVDKRADGWAFGVCLFEALSGRRAFAGSDAADTLAAVLRDAIDWSALPAATPLAVRRLLRRCLERDPRNRLRDMGDARLELLDAASDTDTEAGSESGGVASPRRLALAWVLSLVVCGLVTSLIVWRLKPSTPTRTVRSVLSASPSAALNVLPFRSDLAVTPDGRTVIYSSSEGLYLRPVAELEGSTLPGTEGAAAPFVSPDGEWVGFAVGNELKKVRLRGGQPETICETPSLVNGATWGESGTIVFGTLQGGLYRVPARGGEPALVRRSDPDSGGPDFRYPELLPGERTALLTVGPGTGNGEIAVMDLETGELETVLPRGGLAHYVPTGHLVYGDNGVLQAVGFDLQRLQIRGDPVPVLEGVLTKAGSLAADFAVSSDGSLVYVSAGAGRVQSRLVWVDREGREEAVAVSPADYLYPRVSPDGERVVVSTFGREQDLWIWNFDRSTMTRLTFDTSQDLYSVWSPDGRSIYYSSQTGGSSNDIYRRSADGTGEIERLTESPEALYPSSISPDGRQLILRTGVNVVFDIWLLDLDGSGEGRPLLAAEFGEVNGEISPDGRFLAYQSDESGDWEIYVRPFPEVDDGRWQISSGGGQEPLWSSDGGDLFYRGQGSVMRVPVRTDGGFRPGAAEKLFADRYRAQTGRNYDISPDGERFLMIKTAAEGEEGVALPKVVLVQNWVEELKRLVPTD